MLNLASVFGDRLRKLRKSKKLTQEQLGEVFGLDNTTISKWELGRYETDFEMVHRIARYFGVSADYLTGKTDNPDIIELTEREILDYKKIIEASRKKIDQGNPDLYQGKAISHATLDLLESVLASAQKIRDERDT